MRTEHRTPTNAASRTPLAHPASVGGRTIVMGAANSNPVVVVSEPDSQSMAAYLFSGERDQPAIGLTWSVGTHHLVLEPGDVRAVVGSGPRIYLVTEEESLHGLEGVLGRKFSLPAGAARIWWPRLTASSEPADHPLLLQLDGEREENTLAEFAHSFELSRPLVRREINLIEDARALLEHELAPARKLQRSTEERLRDTQIARHHQAARADAAEAGLKNTAQDAGDQLVPAASSDTVSRALQVALGPDRPEHDEILRVFGGNLKARRVTSGLSQRMLSERCFLPHGRLSRLELGKAAPNLLVLLMLRDALGATLDELAGELSAPTRQPSRLQIHQLIERNPGGSVAEIADVLNLPLWYLSQDAKCMHSLGEIRRSRNGWQPVTGPATRAVEQR